MILRVEIAGRFRWYDLLGGVGSAKPYEYSDHTGIIAGEIPALYLL